MKLINRDTDYAMRALNYIADRGERIVSVSEIAQKLKIPHPFLRKILQMLKKGGVLMSYEGKTGGFELARPLSEIFLVDLIKIFQEPIKLTDCIFKKKICPDAGNCMLKKKIEDIENIVKKEIEELTLASLDAHR